MTTIKTVDKAIESYIALRDLKSERKKKFDAEQAKIDEKMDQIETWLKQEASKQGEGFTGFRTTHGVAFKEVKSKYSCSDIEAYVNWAEDQGVMDDALVYSMRKDFVVNYEKEYGVLPPKINVFREEVMTIRRK